MLEGARMVADPRVICQTLCAATGSVIRSASDSMRS